MKLQPWKAGTLMLLIALASGGLASGQGAPLEPFHNSGQGITGAFEGWFPNEDGTYSLLVGYFNRNVQESADIPVGPDNQIEPGGPDQGQPTHFLPGRAWGLFTITVPADFGDKHLTWTIVAHGQTSVIPLNINALWRLEPFLDATGDTPPYLGFSEDGPFVNGPRGQTKSLTTTVKTPLSLTLWIADDDKDPLREDLQKSSRYAPVKVRWIMFRGTGGVEFDDDAPPVARAELKSGPPGTSFTGKVRTIVNFSEPGEYILNLQAQDSTGGGPAGRQCCWSNAKVKVLVKP
jgi:hypothetical protein